MEKTTSLSVRIFAPSTFLFLSGFCWQSKQILGLRTHFAFRHWPTLFGWTLLLTLQTEEEIYKIFPKPAHPTPWQWSSWRSSASSSFPPLSPPPYPLTIRVLPAGFLFGFQRLLVKQVFLDCDKSESSFCRSQTRYAATFTCQGSGDLLPACFGPGSLLNISDGQFRSRSCKLFSVLGREGQATRHDGRVSSGRWGRPRTSFPQVLHRLDIELWSTTRFGRAGKGWGGKWRQWRTLKTLLWRDREQSEPSDAAAGYH